MVISYEKAKFEKVTRPGVFRLTEAAGRVKIQPIGTLFSHPRLSHETRLWAYDYMSVVGARHTESSTPLKRELKDGIIFHPMHLFKSSFVI